MFITSRSSRIRLLTLVVSISLLLPATPATGQSPGIVVRWATYFGGPSSESAGALAGATSGALTLGGYSFGTDFPTGPGAGQREPGGFADAVVTSLDPLGRSVGYSSYLGGDGQDAVHDAAEDGSGGVYLVGETHSSNFPTTPGVLQPTTGGGQDAFVAKLSPDGSGIEWATYLGGDGYDIAFGSTVGPDGWIYVTGRATSDNFPTTGDAIRRELLGRSDIFVARISPDGKTLGYSTLFGGSNTDARPSAGEAGRAVAVDPAGAIYLTGVTDSSDLPVKPGLVPAGRPLNPRNGGGMGDAFVAKLVPGEAEPAWSGYMGGIGSDSGSAITVDELGVVHAGGSTESPEFPVFQAEQPFHGGFGSFDGWLARIEPGGAGLAWSTFLGGGGNDSVSDLEMNQDGTMWVTGRTSSGDFPTSTDALQPTYGGGAGDGYLTRVAADGSAHVYSTYFGGSGDEGITGLVRTADDAVVVAGGTDSTDLPVTPGALQPENAGGVDLFAASIGSPLTDPVELLTELTFADDSAVIGAYSDEATVAARLVDADGAPLGGMDVAFTLTGASGSSSWSGLTGEDGVASARRPLDVMPGDYTLTASYAGDDSYAGSSVAVPFVVEREQTVTDLVAEGQGSRRVLTATLTEDDGPYLADHEITFFADGTEIGRALTNGAGQATLQAPPGYRGGTFGFEARFPGDDLYRGSTSSEPAQRYLN
jgi:hypothetical protein